MNRVRCWLCGHRYRNTGAYQHVGEPWTWVPVQGCTRCGKVGE